MSSIASPSTGISDARGLEGRPVVGEVADELRFGLVAEGQQRVQPAAGQLGLHLADALLEFAIGISVIMMTPS